MTLLFDTVALSELYKRRQNPSFMHWFDTIDVRTIHVSTITLGEIEKGIEQRRETSPPVAASLASWLEQVTIQLSDRVLPFGAFEARRWGRLTARLTFNGPDTMIAATALTHGLTVVTRNVKHFAPTGVTILNPWELS